MVPKNKLNKAFGLAKPSAVTAFKLKKDVWRSIAKTLFLEIGAEALPSLQLLEKEDYIGLSKDRYFPTVGRTPDTERGVMQAKEFLRKFDGLPGFTPSDRRAAALSQGRDAEKLCALTEKRLRAAIYDNRISSENIRFLHLIELAKEKIKIVLDGGLSRDCSFTVAEFLKCCAWGPGVSDKVSKPSVYNKFDADASFTRGAAPFATVLMEDNVIWREHVTRSSNTGLCLPVVELSRGNRITTVAKDATTDRLIAIEPHWNIYFQLGLGQMIRRRLRATAGIDLKSQATRNRYHALIGSRFGDRSTIDLSSASDTISSFLVRELLPAPWFRVLNNLRSPESYWPDTQKWEENHKFSSMGNGFTFELETLIFWALAQAVVDNAGGTFKVPVFGDDIIVPADLDSQVRALLVFCGFLVNEKKSFSHGPFRESCGMNSYDGVDITPVRLKKLRCLQDLFHLHNALKEKGYPITADSVLDLIPMNMRAYGPSCLGDSVLHSENMLSWHYRLKAGCDSHFFWIVKIQALLFEPDRFRVSRLEPALLNSWYSTSSDAGTNGLFSLRGRGHWRFSVVNVEGVKTGYGRGDF